MALNFPASPAIGDVYRNEGAAFQWTGTVWVALGASPNLGVPTGTVAYFAGNTVPDGWLLCNNQRVTPLYPQLRDYLLAAGSPFGTVGGDPLVPELRGEFLRGFDGGRGVDAGRVFGSAQLDQLQRFTGIFNNIQFLGGGEETIGITKRRAGTNSAIWQGATNVARNTFLEIDTAFDPNIRSGGETRPRNVALLPCIKAFDAVDITGMADLSALLTAVATPAEAIAGVSNEKLMTPFNVRAVLDAEPPQIITPSAVGALAFATFGNPASAASYGQVVAGGSLFPTGAMFRGNFGTGTTPVVAGLGPALSGSWVCLGVTGTFTQATTATIGVATLWQRVE
jgi:Phage Tail Collar Domain